MQTVTAEIKNLSMTPEQAANWFCRHCFAPGAKRTALNENGEFKVSTDGKRYRVSRDEFGYLVWRV